MALASPWIFEVRFFCSCPANSAAPLASLAMRLLGTVGLVVAIGGYGIAQIDNTATEVVGWALLAVGVIMELVFTALYVLSEWRTDQD